MRVCQNAWECKARRDRAVKVDSGLVWFVPTVYAYTRCLEWTMEWTVLLIVPGFPLAETHLAYSWKNMKGNRTYMQHRWTGIPRLTGKEVVTWQWRHTLGKPVCQFQLSHRLCVWPEKNYLTLLTLCFPIYKTSNTYLINVMLEQLTRTLLSLSV